MRFMERFCAPATLLAAAGFVASAFASPAAAQDVKWKTIIGILDAGGNLNNAVGGIPGGGQAWSTLGGHARVDLLSGKADFEVRGLVLGGGNAIGTPGAVTEVKGTLVCIVGATALTFDTPLVPLSSRGDAEFDGNIGPISTACTPANVAFLVRIAANRWIANGAVRTAPGM